MIIRGVIRSEELSLFNISAKL